MELIRDYVLLTLPTDGQKSSARLRLIPLVAVSAGEAG